MSDNPYSMQVSPILLIPEKSDIELEKVVTAWMNRGGTVKRLGKYWIKDDQLSNHSIAIYGNQAFSLVLAQIYNVKLISPDDTLIARLEYKWTKRIIRVLQIQHLKETDFPVFIKPVVPKLFLAGIFQNLISFSEVIIGLATSEEILVSSILDIDAEARSYIKDGKISDIAIYEGAAEVETAREFLNHFLKETVSDLPEVAVIDLAYNSTLGWFILEFNACWGAGLNNCNAEKIIDCIMAATEN